MLAGALTLPESPHPLPAAILVPGSGSHDRDERLFNHRPFFTLADCLSAHGVAVLRLDDRGVGGSTGRKGDASYEDLATDVTLTVQTLCRDGRVDPARVGLIGHSQGGHIAALAAARLDHLAFLALLASPAISIRDCIHHQNAVLARQAGHPDAKIAEVRRLNTALFDLLLNEPDDERAVRRMWDAASAELQKNLGDEDLLATKAQFEPMLRGLANAQGRSMLRADPAAALAGLPCPLLALYGELDFQVPATLNDPAARAALSRSRSPKWDVETLPHLNHLFQLANTGLPNEYATDTAPMDPALLHRLTDWLAGVVGCLGYARPQAASG